MKVLMIEPQKKAYEIEIGNGLADMQRVVGGDIQAVYPYDEPVAIICNEEGKLQGLPLNRALHDEDGNIYDIIAGTFFICGLGEDNFTSLSPELMEQFKEKFSRDFFNNITVEKMNTNDSQLKKRNNYER